MAAEDSACRETRARRRGPAKRRLPCEEASTQECYRYRPWLGNVSCSPRIYTTASRCSERQEDYAPVAHYCLASALDFVCSPPHDLCTAPSTPSDRKTADEREQGCPLLRRYGGVGEIGFTWRAARACRHASLELVRPLNDAPQRDEGDPRLTVGQHRPRVIGRGNVEAETDTPWQARYAGLVSWR